MADGWWDCRSCCTVCMTAEMNSDAHHLHTSIRWNREHDTSLTFKQYRTVLICLRYLFFFSIWTDQSWNTVKNHDISPASQVFTNRIPSAFLSIRWGYFLPVKMPYGFGQWNLLHPARETKGFLWGALGIANGTQVDVNFIDKHVQLLALWELTIWYTVISDWWFIIYDIYVSCFFCLHQHLRCICYDDLMIKHPHS